MTGSTKASCAGRGSRAGAALVVLGVRGLPRPARAREARLQPRERLPRGGGAAALLPLGRRARGGRVALEARQLGVAAQLAGRAPRADGGVAHLGVPVDRAARRGGRVVLVVVEVRERALGDAQRAALQPVAHLRLELAAERGQRDRAAVVGAVAAVEREEERRQEALDAHAHRAALGGAPEDEGHRALEGALEGDALDRVAPPVVAELRAVAHVRRQPARQPVLEDDAVDLELHRAHARGEGGGGAGARRVWYARARSPPPPTI